jgi:hypothetical protein
MIASLITLIIYLLILGIVLWLVYYVVDAIPLPEPINKIVKLAVVVLACLVIIVLLLQMVGGVQLNIPKIG